MTEASAPPPPPSDINGVLSVLERACAGDAEAQISLEALLDALGRKSFAPFLVLPPIIAITPPGAIPGVPSAMAAIVVLAALQMLCGFKHVWLPRFLEVRSLKAKSLNAMLRLIRPVARALDRVLKRRLVIFTEAPFLYAILAFCILAGLTMPVMELIPFAAAVPNVAILTFGLALLVRDGLLALFASGVASAGMAMAAAILL
jgi:hypothetical protein